MSAKLKVIDEMTLDEIIKNYDDEAPYSSGGISFWLDVYNNKKNELVMDEQKKINKQMLSYTKAMTFMTIIVLVATLINLYVVIIK
jgi:hypothetical protein